MAELEAPDLIAPQRYQLNNSIPSKKHLWVPQKSGSCSIPGKLKAQISHIVMGKKSHFIPTASSHSSKPALLSMERKKPDSWLFLWKGKSRTYILYSRGTAQRTCLSFSCLSQSTVGEPSYIRCLRATKDKNELSSLLQSQKAFSTTNTRGTKRP